MTSPFQTLALHPFIIERLSAKQIPTIAEGAQKGLQLAFHTDIQQGEDHQLSSTINTNVELLSTPTNAEEYRTQYLRDGPGQARVRAAEQQLRDLLTRIAGAEENIERTSRAVYHATASIPCLISAHEFMKSIFLAPKGKSGDMGDSLRFTPGTSFYYTIPTPEFELDFKGKWRDALGLVKIRAVFSKSSDTSKITADFLRCYKTLYYWVKLIEDTLKSDDYNRIAYLNHLIQPNFVREWETEGLSLFLKDLECELELLFDEFYMFLKADLDDAVKAEVEDMLQEARKEVNEISRVRKGEVDQDGYLVLDDKKTTLKMFGVIRWSDGSSSTLSADFLSEIENDHDFYTLAFHHMVDLFAVDSEGTLHAVGLVHDYSTSPKFKTKRDTKQSQSSSQQSADSSQSQPLDQPEQSTALTKAGVQVQYKRNPFEVIGVLPSLLQQLSEDQLKLHIKHLVKSILEATHPESQTPDAELYREVNLANQQLDNPKTFKQAYKEYKDSKPGEARAQAILELKEKEAKVIPALIRELTETKSRSARVKRLVDSRMSSAKVFTDLIIQGVYYDPPSHHPGGPYLHRSHRTRLSVLTPSKLQEYTLQVKAFDVFAVSDSARVRLLGSSCPDISLSPDQLQDALDDLPSYRDAYLLAHPVLYKGSHLIGIDDSTDKSKPFVVGKIEKMDAMETARKIKKKDRKPCEQVRKLPKFGRTSEPETGNRKPKKRRTK